jgi:predicted RNase H-like nuclease (RuvC/YqgF family)
MGIFSRTFSHIRRARIFVLTPGKEKIKTHVQACLNIILPKTQPGVIFYSGPKNRQERHTIKKTYIFLKRKEKVLEELKFKIEELQKYELKLNRTIKHCLENVSEMLSILKDIKERLEDIYKATPRIKLRSDINKYFMDRLDRLEYYSDGLSLDLGQGPYSSWTNVPEIRKNEVARLVNEFNSG